MSFEAEIIAEIVFCTELDYFEYTQNATKNNLKFHNFLRFSPIFDTLFPLILNTLMIIQLGEKTIYAIILASKLILELVKRLKTVETTYFNV